MTSDRNSNTKMNEETARFVAAAQLAVDEAIERDREILRLRKKYDAKARKLGLSSQKRRTPQ